MRGFTTPAPNPACASCHSLPTGHLVTGGAACSSCHTLTAWTPASGGGHSGALPTANFPYDTWSRNWFREPHHSANQCNECHTQISTQGYKFYSCTTFCHTNQSSLNNKHSGEHLYHFDPNAQNSPPDEGGAVWPTAHVGCAKSGCHR